MKAEFLAEAEALFDELMAWDENTPKPNLTQIEDVVLQLDRTLAELFKYIDNTVGLDNTLIVLSADHGMADMPEYMDEQGYKVGRIKQEELIKAANDVGKKQFGIDRKSVV